MFTLGANWKFCAHEQEKYCQRHPERCENGVRTGYGAHVELFWFGCAGFFPAAAIVLAIDIAATSTLCDKLMAVLHAVGIKHGPEHHDKIDWLESRLRGLSQGQGLGFVLPTGKLSPAGLVINLSVLQGSFIKFISAWGFVSTALVGLGQSGLAADGSHAA